MHYTIGAVWLNNLNGFVNLEGRYEGIPFLLLHRLYWFLSAAPHGPQVLPLTPTTGRGFTGG